MRPLSFAARDRSYRRRIYGARRQLRHARRPASIRVAHRFDWSEVRPDNLGDLLAIPFDRHVLKTPGEAAVVPRLRI
jgi:hypothetical protein